MKKLLIALMVAGVMGGAVYGAAASITVGTPNLGAGGSDVVACDSSIDVDYVLSYQTVGGYTVTNVELDLDDNACEGAEVTVQLTDETDAAIVGATGTATVVEGVNPTVITLTTPTAAEDVFDVHVAAQGGEADA